MFTGKTAKKEKSNHFVVLYLSAKRGSPEETNRTIPPSFFLASWFLSTKSIKAFNHHLLSTQHVALTNCSQRPLSWLYFPPFL